VSRHLGSLVLATALLLTASACSDDTSPEPEPSDSPTSTTSAPVTSGSPTSQPPTSEPPPSVTPAAGLKMTQGHLSVRAPEGWKKTPEPTTGEFSEQADEAASGSTLYISELPDLAPGAEVDLDVLARSAIKNAHYVQDPEIVEPEEIAGVAWYHTSGFIGGANHEEAFGTITGGFVFQISLRTLKDAMSPAEREDLLASILASVELDL